MDLVQVHTCSGPETPKPTQTGLSVWLFSDWMRPSTRDSVLVRVPVTPAADFSKTLVLMRVSANQRCGWVSICLDTGARDPCSTQTRPRKRGLSPKEEWPEPPKPDC